MAASALEETLALQLRATRAPAFVREYRFAPPRRWRFDFAWPDRQIAVEVDGGTWVQGKHSRGAGVHNDCEKACQAAILGWRVLRVDSVMVRDGTALRAVQAALGG
jgi:very-short-patch-repair endonuclease